MKDPKKISEILLKIQEPARKRATGELRKFKLTANGETPGEEYVDEEEEEARKKRMRDILKILSEAK